jgi:hypothetical protein
MYNLSVPGKQKPEIKIYPHEETERKTMGKENSVVIHIPPI